MQGAKEFYHLEDLKSGKGQCSCFVHFNKAHEIFTGHFPGNPIVPGVCTMAIVKNILEYAVDKSLVLSKASTVKYLGLIRPEMQVKVDLTWNLNENVYQVNAKISMEAEVLFKMSAEYRLA